MVLPNHKRHPQEYTRIIQQLKLTRTWKEIAALTGVSERVLLLRKAKMGFTTHSIPNRNPRPFRGHRPKYYGGFDIPEERPDYKNDVLPFAIRDEAERRGMTVDEFLAANERGEV